MDITRAMRVFVAVVDGGSFAAAAEQFDTSSASISRQIAALEKHLGASLLKRTTRRLSLSAPGRLLYDRAQQILEDIAEVESVVGKEATEPSGDLRISVPLSYGISDFARYIPAFHARHPGVHLNIDLTDRMIDLVSGTVDVALRIAQAPSPHLVARKIAPVRVVTCAAPSYLARRGTPTRPEDLESHDTLGYTYHAQGDTWSFFDAAGQERVARIKPIIHANNGDLLCKLAVDGCGISALPLFIVADALAAGTLVPLLDGWETREANLYAVYLGRRFLSPKVRLFIDFLVEVAGGPEPGPRGGSAAVLQAA